MAGIYVHIPFCRRKCYYCDFYKTTALQKKVFFLEAINREIALQKDYLKNETVETVYLGGGTPSVLSVGEVKAVLMQLEGNFNIDPGAEITLETNPDDLHPAYFSGLHQAGVNRLSIGIQSFSDRELQKMNRRHTAAQAVRSVYEVADAGFTDVSIDLIYGIPGSTLQQWTENLEIAVKLPVNHISAYHLTYHDGTVFDKWLKMGTLEEIPEEESIAQFEELIRISAEAGFEQYEISNFARNNAYAKHNSSYWQGKNYLGLGPSAHSYNGFSRQWNIADLAKYMTSVQSNQPFFESEILTEKDKLNDYLITGIRTKWGISLSYIGLRFGEEMQERIMQSALTYLDNNLLKLTGDTITLTKNGMMVSDQVMLALLIG